MKRNMMLTRKLISNHQGFLNIRRTLALLVVWLLLPTASSAEEATKTLAPIIKSPSDIREYQGFMLANELKVIVVSDPSTKVAAASLDVDVGTSANPEGREGLAHFLEHMLFLGTSKYPDAGDYQAFISNNGGSHNAFTAPTNTNYHFSIDANQLEPALDRFAQFFIAPLFTPKYVDREKHAVHSEFQSNLNQDGRRVFAASRQAYNPKHSYSKFAVGSLNTLADRPDSKIRDELIDFYNRYYSANIMSLVVVGPQSISELKTMVLDKFSAIENSHVTISPDPVSLYRTEDLPAKISIQTLKDTHSLSLTFPTPAIKPHWHKKPLRYLAAEFGYEGNGSLLALFKEKGWANSLAASPGFSLDTEASFRIDMRLTPEGFKHQQEIIQYIFDFANKLQKGGIRQDIFEEEKSLSEASFLYQETPAPLSLARYLAQQHQEYDASQVLRAPYAYDSFDPELIKHFLSFIRPDNLLISIKSRSVETDRISPWFKVPYAYATLLASEGITIAQQPNQDASKLYIRGANPYVPDHFELLSQDKASVTPNKTPILLSDNHQREIWYADNGRFQQPKADIYVSLLNKKIASTPALNVTNDMLVQLINDSLTAITYDANIAGLSSQIYPHMRGMSIKLSGFSQPLPRLFTRVTQHISQFQVDPKRFAVIKQRMAQQMANSAKENAYKQAISEVYRYLLDNPTLEQQLSALQALTPAQVQAHHQQLVNQSYLRLLVHGNLSSEATLAMGDYLVAQFQTPKNIGSINRPKVKKLSNQTVEVDINTQQNNAAIVYYAQAEDSRENLVRRASYGVLSDALAPAFYTRLRTELQLGYVVFGMPLNLLNTQGVSFVVESPIATPERLKGEIETFVPAFTESQLELSDEAFEGHKQSVLAQLKQPETTRSELSNRWWSEVDQNNRNFDIKDELIAALEQLTKEEYFTVFDDWMDKLYIVTSAAASK